MKSYKNKFKNNNIILSNIENSTSKKVPDISIGNLHTSEYSTIFTNSNININSNLERMPTPLSPTKDTAYNTIDEYTKDMICLSKISLEYDLYISSLKKKLVIIKEKRKQSEMNVTNLKRKIFELQKEEQKSLRQLENTKKYIKKIIDNRKRHSNTKKNYDIKITKINNFFQTSKSPNNRLYNTNSFNRNTWVAPFKKKTIIKNKNLTHIKTLFGNENNEDNNYLSISHKFKNNLNINNIISNSGNKKIYSRKKVELKNKMSNHCVKLNNSNNKIIKENLIKTIKKDEEEKIKIQKQIEEIEKEQNNLYNNFYEKLGFYCSSKTLDCDKNFINYYKLKK